VDIPRAVERFAVMNNAYARYSFAYFLNSMSELGLRNIDLWGGIQHLDAHRATDAQARAFAQGVRARGFELVSYTPEFLDYPYNFASPDKTTREKSVQYAQRNIELAAGMEISVMLVPPGWGLLDRPYEESFALAADSLSRLAEYAGGFRVKLALEHLTPQSSNLLTGLDAVRRMLGQTNSPWLGMALDVGQMSVFGETVGAYFAAMGDRVLGVHMMDGTPSFHLAFGDGILPVRDYYEELTRQGYDGVITLEINDGRYAREPHEALRQCLCAISEW
jgi:protein FrlC